MVSETVSSKARASRRPAVVDRLLGVLKADFRKTAVLCTLAAVFAVILIRNSVRPDSAKAMVGEFLPPTETNAVSERTALESVNPSKSAGATAIETTMKTRRLKSTLPQRDIFAIDLSYFAKQSGKQVGNEGQVSRPDPEQLKLAALRRQVQELSLQSTMTGPVLAAYIDGSILVEADVHKGFKIVRIKDRQVLLEKDRHVFILNMGGE